MREDVGKILNEIIDVFHQNGLLSARVGSLDDIDKYRLMIRLSRQDQNRMYQENIDIQIKKMLKKLEGL